MANKRNKTTSGTNISEVQKQNNRAAGKAQNQYENEFASETNLEEVKKQNKQSEQNKK